MAVVTVSVVLSAPHPKSLEAELDLWGRSVNGAKEGTHLRMLPAKSFCPLRLSLLFRIHCLSCSVVAASEAMARNAMSITDGRRFMVVGGEQDGIRIRICDYM